MKVKTFRACSVAALATVFALSGCASGGIGADTDSSAAAQQFSASVKEVEEWRVAAGKGDASAQYYLGLAYFYGVGGVTKNDREAERWVRKAAEQGYAEAQNAAGLAYARGDVVAKDAKEAVRWFRKAAEQGYAAAQTNLGWAYETGEGVAKDMREAVRWQRKAAEQGETQAQYDLSAAYSRGEGVIADMRESYIWAAIAKAGGHAGAAAVLDNSDYWRSGLSRSEIQSAQKEAARRLDAINRRKDGGIVSAPKPKDANIAERVFENTWRSVVVVHNGSGQGSGVIVRPNIVATNCHVVDGYGGITVYKSDNRRADTGSAFSATIRESDEDKDFCLLDVDGLWGVPVAVRKYGTLGVGEDVYGLGAPQGLDLSLSRRRDFATAKIPRRALHPNRRRDFPRLLRRRFVRPRRKPHRNFDFQNHRAKHRRTRLRHPGRFGFGELSGGKNAPGHFAFAPARSLLAYALNHHRSAHLMPSRSQAADMRSWPILSLTAKT